MNVLCISNRFRLIVAATAVALLATGCSTAPTRDPAYAPVMPPIKEATKPSNGAIYMAALDAPVISDVAFFRDIRAHRVGDILTIKLVEKTAATKTAETEIEQTTTFDVDNPTVFGATPSIKWPNVLGIADKVLPSPTGDDRYTLGVDLDSKKEFDGEGDSNQSNSLTGDITVSVAEVLPNGNMKVQGEKIFTLNHGHEQVRFSGIVRPMDIDANNTVFSTRVANATIVYTGEGDMADANKMGWLARFFISAFWPF